MTALPGVLLPWATPAFQFLPFSDPRSQDPQTTGIFRGAGAGVYLRWLVRVDHWANRYFKGSGVGCGPNVNSGTET